VCGLTGSDQRLVFLTQVVPTSALPALPGRVDLTLEEPLGLFVPLNEKDIRERMVRTQRVLKSARQIQDRSAETKSRTAQADDDEEALVLPPPEKDCAKEKFGSKSECARVRSFWNRRDPGTCRVLHRQYMEAH